MFAVHVCIPTIHTYVRTNKHTFVVHRLVIVLLSKFAPSAHPWVRYTLIIWVDAVFPLCDMTISQYDLFQTFNLLP